MPNYAFFIFILFMGLLGGELVLSAGWVPIYFRYGIPLFRARHKLTKSHIDLEPYIPQLEQQLPRQWRLPAIAFKAIDKQELAFRQKFGQRNPAHGHLRIDPYQQELIVTGYLYWFTLIFPIWFIFIVGSTMFSTGMTSLIILGFTLFIIATTAFTQRSNYNRINNVVQQTFSDLIATGGSFHTPSYFEDVAPPPKADSYADMYQPYDPMASNKPKSGLSSTEIMLVVILLGLLALVAFFAVFYFLTAVPS